MFSFGKQTSRALHTYAMCSRKYLQCTNPIPTLFEPKASTNSIPHLVYLRQQCQQVENIQIPFKMGKVLVLQRIYILCMYVDKSIAYTATGGLFILCQGSTILQRVQFLFLSILIRLRDSLSSFKSRIRLRIQVRQES